MSDVTEADANVDGKIVCHICDARVHVISTHLNKDHPETDLQQYQDTYPGAPIISDKAASLREQQRNKTANAEVKVTEPSLIVRSYDHNYDVSKAVFHEAFGFGSVAAALSNKQQAISIDVIHAPELVRAFVPQRDTNYQFPIELTKTVTMGFQANIPVYLYGHAGTGKTTIAEQVSAVTGRPALRIQHTRNMEESHVLGQWVVREGQTVFELGPLAYAMKYGLVYLADEYDFGMPAVLSLYQPVLEGKSLVIKDADLANRVINPHPLFRFIATGNTNGTGDETGLYQGTLMQNAANYERFGIVEEVLYMEKTLEISVVSAQGGIPKPEAEKLVEFARLIRESFSNGKIGLPISPRALINAARIGTMMGSFRKALNKSYLNRLSRIDKQSAEQVLIKMDIK